MKLSKEAIYEGNSLLVAPYYTECLYMVREEFFDKRSKTKGIIVAYSEKSSLNGV